MMDLSGAPCTAEERARWFRSYLKALKEERHKIQVFQKELPLSLHLVTQAIESYRQQIASDVVAGGSSLEEAEEEETSTEGAPILEEFIPLKRGSSSAAEDEEEASGRQLPDHQGRQKKASAEKKHDWLRSVQLWTQQPDSGPLPTEEGVIGRGIDERRSRLYLDTNKSTSAFVPFHPPQRSPAAVAAERAAALKLTAPATSSNSDLDRGESIGCGGRDDKDVQPQRKIRRCWSVELHRKFLEALRQLGGADSATPKRILEWMKVDGLTNDEVKSHLQKYRLHSRRPSPTSHASSAGAPPQQLAVVGGGGGGICVPPPEYAAVRPPSEGKPTNSPSGVYAPVASVPAPRKQRQHHRRGVIHSGSTLPGDQDEHCIEEDGSEASAASSSTRTTTSSPGGHR